jgi:cell wall-associated NlpC family hydrolase
MSAPPSTPSFDRRTTPARPDLAADFLRGKVEASRYVTGEKRVVTMPSTPLSREPRQDISIDTEALFGETVTVYETNDEGWCWGQLETDGYVGFLSAAALAQIDTMPSHRVSALRTFIYPQRTIKAPVEASLSMGCLVTISRIVGDFAELASGGFVWAGHLVPLDDYAQDFVAVAEGFLNAPYLWGGRTSLGLDCSALVQLSLAAAGQRAPRDSDMMERQLGVALDCTDGLPMLCRGDLIFWKGHVGIMQNAITLLHANGHFMGVVSETVKVAADRIRAAGAGPITAVKRL